MSRRNSLHHLYYSSHADPLPSPSHPRPNNMLRSNTLRSKSTHNLASSNSNKFGSRWTLAQTESSELLQKKQEDLHNTYYNNMVMYINNKSGDNESSLSGLRSKRSLGKSRESLYSTMLPLKEDKEETEECGACRQCDTCCDNCCCSFWSWILAFLFAIFGFLGGIIVGAVVQRNGFLHEMGIVIPGGENYYYGNYDSSYIDESYMNQFVGQEQSRGFSGKTRIILPGEEGDPNRVIIPGQYNNNNNFNNLNQQSNNMYQNNMYPNNNMNNQNQKNNQNMFASNKMYPNQNNNNNLFQNNNNWNQNNQRMNPGNNNFFQNNNMNNRRMFPSNNNQGMLPHGDPRCMMQYGWLNTSYTPGSCALCSISRMINVTGAGYADCDGLYTISNMSSIWDNKRIVYERVAGGWRPMDKRYIYWNAHYFGENFYGWSIGDKQSLSESGPFHSQGRIGASNQPWLGTWRANVSVELVTCNSIDANMRDFANSGWERGNIRINPKQIQDLQKMRERNNQYPTRQQDTGNFRRGSFN